MGENQINSVQILSTFWPPNFKFGPITMENNRKSFFCKIKSIPGPIN